MRSSAKEVQGATGRRRREVLEAIADPRQRALAGRADEVVRLFLSGDLPVGERLVEGPPSGGDPDARGRNYLRLFALGALGTLGKELGLSWSEMNGLTVGGRTQVPDLAGLHRNTVVQASELFEALISQAAGPRPSELAVLAAERYRQLLRDCKADLRAICSGREPGPVTRRPRRRSPTAEVESGDDLSPVAA